MRRTGARGRRARCSTPGKFAVLTGSALLASLALSDPSIAQTPAPNPEQAPAPIVAPTAALAPGHDACAAMHADMPDRLIGWRLVGRQTYPNPDYGFAAQYEDRDATRLSVFHYTDGQSFGPAPDVAAMMRAEMGRIVAYMRAQGLTPTTPFQIGLSDSGNPAAAQQGFRQAFGIRDITVLGVTQGCIVKLRYTGPPLETETLRRLWDRATQG